MPEARIPVERRALVIAGAAGPPESANQVLARFGFQPAQVAPTLALAVPRLRSEHFDLVIVPLDSAGEADLTVLERELPHDGTTSVIGTARRADSDLVLRALRAGMHEFVTFPPEANELSAAIERLVRRRAVRPSSGLTIASYSPKGGMGTTTVAVNLAWALAQQDASARVAVADLVAVGGDVRVVLNLKPAFDVSDVASKLERLDANLVLSLLTHPADRVWALPASDRVEAADLIDAAGASMILAQLRSQFSYVIVDTEHHLGERTLAALDAADHVLLVTQLTVPALRSAQGALRLFARLGYPPRKLHVVLNRFDADETLTPADAIDVLGHEIFWKLPNDYHACADALTRGVPVVAHRPDSPLAKSYQRMASRIVNDRTAGDGAGGNEQGATLAERGRGARVLRLGRK